MSTLTLWAEDLSAATRWYTELLGVEPYFTSEAAGRGPGYLEFRIGDYQHELGIIDRRFAPPGLAAGPGGAITYWHVDDAAAALARLVSLGAKQLQGISERGPGLSQPRSSPVRQCLRHHVQPPLPRHSGQARRNAVGAPVPTMGVTPADGAVEHQLRDNDLQAQGGDLCNDERRRNDMTDEVFLNSYQNASTPPAQDVPADQARFMLAADPILAQAAELARVITRAHQSAAVQLVGEGWAYARKYFSLSEKYAAWSDYRQPATGAGIHGFAHKISKPLRLTDAELRAHPEWRNFSGAIAEHPPMRGWLVTPLIGSDGLNYGFIQVTDRLEGDFTEQDEANLVRLATLTSTALDALAQLHLPDYRDKVARIEQARQPD